MKANVWAAVAWVNALRPSNEPYALTIYDAVVENVDQLVTMRIFTNRFRSKDTLDEMRKLVEAQFGPMTASNVGPVTGKEYEWQLTPTRWVRLIYKPDYGTFIQLIDKG